MMTRLSFIFATIVAVMMMVGNNDVHALQRGAKTGRSDEEVQNLRQLKMENRGIGMSGMTAMASMGGMTAMASMGSMGGMTAMASMGGMTAMGGGMGGMRRAETVAERTRTRVTGIKGGRIINNN